MAAQRRRKTKQERLDEWDAKYQVLRATIVGTNRAWLNELDGRTIREVLNYKMSCEVEDELVHKLLS